MSTAFRSQCFWSEERKLDAQACHYLKLLACTQLMFQSMFCVCAERGLEWRLHMQYMCVCYFMCVCASF